MGAVISNLKARFGVDSGEFKKGLKDGEQALGDFENAALSSIDEVAEMFGANMGQVNSALDTARQSMNYFVSSLNAGAAGGNKMAIAMKVLRSALIATGLGALVVALGSVIAYFQKSGEGAEKFSRILSQVRSVLDNLVERLVRFGGGLVDIFSGRFREGWERMKAAFHGIGQEIAEDWKAAGNLADAESALEKREIALITTLEERRAKIAQLRLEAREEMNDYRAKLSLIEQAERLIISVYGDQVAVEKERLRIMKERIALTTTDPTPDQLREIRNQEAKVSSLIGDQADKLREITREKNTTIKLLNKQIELEKEREQLLSKMAKASGAATMQLGLDLDKFSKDLKEIQTITTQTISEITIDLTNTINDALTDLFVELGEALGQLASGEAGLKDFTNMILESLADLAVKVGKIVIAAGVAALFISETLMSLDPTKAVGAIAAGVALVALGTAVKGALSSALSGGSASTASIAAAGGGNINYDTRVANMKQELEITGRLTASGPDLVYVFNKESTRRKATT